MRIFLLFGVIGALCLMAGCGGGGGGTPAPVGVTTLATSNDGKVVLKGRLAAVPTGVTPTIQSVAAADLQLPGLAFAAAAECKPAATVFSEAVTLTFTLANAIPANKEVRLYEYSTSNSWAYTGIKATLSDNRLTATVSITHFGPNQTHPYYVLAIEPEVSE